MRRQPIKHDKKKFAAYLSAWSEFRGQKTLRQICEERGLDFYSVRDFGYNLRSRPYKNTNESD